MNTHPAAAHPATEPLPVREVLAQLWRAAGLNADALARFGATGQEPALPSSFAIGTLLQAALGAATLAATEVLRSRGAQPAIASVDMQDVVRESACRFTLDGRSPVVWDKLSGLYACAAERADTVDGRNWVRVHANFAHHRDGVLALLGLPVGPDTERAAVAAALRNWSAQAFEDAAAERGLVVAALRSPAQWAAHPQAAALADQPLLGIERSGNAPPLVFPAGGAALEGPQALNGLRVLELTRILAGPVAGRTLAAHGADVLLVNAPHLPNIEALAETSRGKLSSLLDLRRADDCATLRKLIQSSDVFLHGYRPGALAARGFGPAELERLRPGIVSVSLSAYGDQGPWGLRRGFDSLVQSATGLNLAEAKALGSSEPRALPLQALDYGAGYLLAFGALAALLHQRQSGGSWQVRVSLAGVAQWLTRIGRIADPARAPALDFDTVMEEHNSGFGRLRSLPHAGRIDGKRLTWRRIAMPPGSHPAAWPAPA